MTKESLLNRTEKLTMDEVCLKTLLDFYEEYLLPHIFEYELHTGEIIRLCFYKENLCHLLGLQHIQQGSNYRGITGYENIQKEKITWENLKKSHYKKVKAFKDKFQYFHFIYPLVKNPQILLYDSHKIKTHIQAAFILYDSYSNAYIHLGIDEKSPGNYFPRTFFVEKLTPNDSPDKFIRNQPKMKIIRKSIYERKCAISK